MTCYIVKIDESDQVRVYWPDDMYDFVPAGDDPAMTCENVAGPMGQAAATWVQFYLASGGRRSLDAVLRVQAIKNPSDRGVRD